MSSYRYKPDSHILKDLLAWAEVNCPAELRRFHSCDDCKAAARDLLLFRIGKEESFVHELSDALVVKLGGEVDHVYDERELSLARAIGARPERRIR